MSLDGHCLSESSWSVVRSTDFHLDHVHAEVITRHEDPRIGDTVWVQRQSVREDDFCCPIVIVFSGSWGCEDKIACIEVFLNLDFKDVAIRVQGIRRIRSRRYDGFLIGDVEHDVVGRTDRNEDTEF